MKIALVGNYFYPEHIGGIEIVSYHLVKYYREEGHQVRWIAADVPPRYRNLTEGDVPIRAWNITEEKFGFPQPLPRPDVAVKLYRSVQWCDVVHLQDCLYPINILAFVISKLLKKPVIITQHTEIIPYKNRLKLWLQSFALRSLGVVMHRYSDKTVFISTNTRDHLPFITRHVKDPVVIPNGVDTDLFSPLPQETKSQLRQKITGDNSKPILLFVGRFVAIKGIQLLIPVIEKHPEWHWLLVGRPDEYDPSTWGYSNITFWPSLGLEEMRTAYAIADLSVHPSEVVGMSLTILECMSCGTPVMVNEDVLYGVPEDDLENFILVRPKTEQIENAITSLLADPMKLDAYAGKARSYILSHSGWREVAGKYLNLLENIRQSNGL